MTQTNQSNQYKKTLQHVTLWGCLANSRYRQLGTAAAIAFIIGMVPQVSMASDISEVKFLAQLQAVEDALDLSSSPRIEKLIELSKQGNIAADMTLYRYKHRGENVEYTPNTANVTQAIQILNNSADDNRGLVGLFKGSNYADGNLNLAKDYAKSIQSTEQAANKGNARAMSNIGLLYHNGQGVAQDYQTAMSWYKKAADKGNAYAMIGIGFLYSNGYGVAQDYQTAMSWYKKAADKGDAHAMTGIGDLYDRGYGVTRDYQAAMSWYKKAADKGEAAAMTNIGVMYREGQGVTQDYTTAMSWYKKAADKGNTAAMNNIGYLYREGHGVAQDYTTAMSWYKKAADKGNTAAMNNIGYLYREGHGVAQDYQTAMSWYKKAADKGDTDAIVDIGYLYSEGHGVTQNYDTAMSWYKKAADKGDANAMTGIGYLYSDGQGVPQDSNKAAQFFVKAYKSLVEENNRTRRFTEVKQHLETLLVSKKITDPVIRKQVESLFATPPLITWQSAPPDTIDNETLTLSVLLTDQGGGIGDVRVLLNGIAIDQNSRGLSRAVNQTTRDFTLSIPKGTHTLIVEAYPGENVGITSTVSKQITSTYAPIQKPKLHAVVIGIDHYQNPDLKLNYAAKDANAIYDVLNKQVGGIYDKGSINLLITTSTTSKDNIINKINQIKQTAKMNDVFVFYAAAHGYNYPDTGYHLFTSDVGATSSRQVTKTGINAEELQGLLAQVNTNKKLILLDTCDSGGSIDAGQLITSRGLDDQMVIDRMQRKAGATVIMASTDKQKALEGYQGHGVFTYGLLQAFNGAGDMDKDGYIKTGELSNYIEDEIPNIAQKAFKQPQYPTASTIGNGFEFKVF